MTDINKSFDQKKLTKIVQDLTENPDIITNYNSTYHAPNTPKITITPKEKTRE